jgi:hypothetical protein
VPKQRNKKGSEKNRKCVLFWERCSKCTAHGTSVIYFPPNPTGAVKTEMTKMTYICRSPKIKGSYYFLFLFFCEAEKLKEMARAIMANIEQLRKGGMPDSMPKEQNSEAPAKKKAKKQKKSKKAKREL